MARIDLGKVVGESATISVGNVTTLEAGQNATVVNTGTELNGVFDFGIPKGPKGDAGATGATGPEGPQGVQGKAFTIDKTYSSVLDMEADFNNMEVGSYVMIASNVESEDNARLYYRDTNEWKFISDFSGATGIQGEQGPQGPAGRDGTTPVKGVDYFTSADIAEIEDDIKEITGELANLDTTDKTSLVSAINEVVSNGGGADIYRVTSRNIDLLGLKRGTYILDPNSINVFTVNVYYSPLTSGNDSWQLDLSNGSFYILTDITNNLPNDTPVLSYFYSDGDGIQQNILYSIDNTSSGYAGLKSKTVRKSFNILTTTALQIISGKKTFSTLPESSITPTTNNQLTNKKYVDDAVASAGGGADVYAISSKNVDLAGLKKGVYVFDKDILSGTSSVSFYCSYYATGANTKQYGVPLGMFVVLRDVTDDLENGTSLVTFYSMPDGRQRIYNIYVNNTQSAGIDSTSLAGDELLLSNGYQTISGVKTFTALPQSSVVPTTDTQMVNKKYVDDAIAAAIANLQQ